MYHVYILCTYQFFFYVPAYTLYMHNMFIVHRKHRYVMCILCIYTVYFLDAPAIIFTYTFYMHKIFIGHRQHRYTMYIPRIYLIYLFDIQSIICAYTMYMHNIFINYRLYVWCVSCVYIMYIHKIFFGINIHTFNTVRDQHSYLQYSWIWVRPISRGHARSVLPIQSRPPSILWKKC